MARKSDKSSQLLNSLRGALMFTIIVAGITYYLQSSLALYKHYGSHIHWSVVLVALPLLAGLLLRLLRVAHPLLSVAVGACAATALLYPAYKGFWALPPKPSDVAIYLAIVLGLGYIATQPLSTTFMAAFRIGRFAVPSFSAKESKGARSPSRQAKTTGERKGSLSKTQRLQASGRGNSIAMLELAVGIASLALSIFSIFFLGRG